MNNKNISLYAVWIQQMKYNQLIKARKSSQDVDWMTDYILGTVSELGELLREMSWKKHRSHSSVEFGPNISEELADITKYVISMWQIAGFTPQDMLNSLHRKGQILDQLYRQETPITYTGEKIIILDLDGVIADFRQGFSHWIKTSHWSGKLDIDEKEYGIHLDLNNGWEYSTYEEAKLEFEKIGGYNSLPPITEVISAIQDLYDWGFIILVWTARPNQVYKRIRFDTWSWLMNSKIPAEALYFGGDDRILLAKKLSEFNFVVAFEDNPVLAKRYAISKIPVLLFDQPYNRGLELDGNITRISEKDSSSSIADIVKIISIREKETRNG